MKMTQNLTARAALLSAMLAIGGAFGVSSSFAQTVATAPVGAISYTIAAAPVGGLKVTTISPNLRLPVAGAFVGKSRGVVETVSATSIGDSTAAWAAAGLSNAATPYYIRIRTGAAAGAMWQISTSSANTASAVTVVSISGLNPSVAGVVSGDQYEIVPADTLDSFFASVEGQIGGSSLATADNVRIHDGSGWRNYYYNSGAGQWRESTSTFNRNTTIIRPESGIIFTRRAPSTVTIQLVGNVADMNEKFVVPSLGASFIGGVFPVDQTVASLNIENSPGFVKNSGSTTTTLAAADKLRFFDGTSFRTLNFSQANSQWREGTGTFNRGTLVIPAGTPIIIERGSGATGSSALFTLTRPYSL